MKPSTALISFIIILSVIEKGFCYTEIVFSHCEQIAGDREKFMDWSNLKVKKLNKTTRAIVGNITYHVTQDDSFLVEVLGFHKQGGEYRLMPYKLPQTGFCTALNNDELFYPELVKVSTFPKPLPCPFTARVITVHGFSTSLKNFPPTIHRSGDYAIEGRVIKEKEILIRWRVYFSVVHI